MASSPASVSGGGPTAGPEFDLRIRSVNPGLNKMLNRVKAVYVMLGGVDEPRLDPRVVHTFDFKKSAFIAHLQRVDDVSRRRLFGNKRVCRVTPSRAVVSSALRAADGGDARWVWHRSQLH